MVSHLGNGKGVDIPDWSDSERIYWLHCGAIAPGHGNKQKRWDTDTSIVAEPWGKMPISQLVLHVHPVRIGRKHGDAAV